MGLFDGLGDWFSANDQWLVPAMTTAGTALYGMSQNNAAAQTQANALQQASATQQQAADNSLNFLRYAYDTSRGDQAPWRQAGQNALGTYAGQLGTQYQQSPGYQFAFNEGQRAVQNSAAANGMLGSGATAKALTRYGQGMANQDYGQWMNRQAALAGVGQTAANASGAAAQNYGQSAASVSSNLGNSLGANQANIGNVYGNAMTAGANNLAGGANSLLKYASATPGFWG